MKAEMVVLGIQRTGFDPKSHDATTPRRHDATTPRRHDATMALRTFGV